MLKSALLVFLLGMAGGPFLALAGDGTAASPEAAGRTYAQNYKDMLFATCVARAYKGAPQVNKDAVSSVGVLVEWTQYDAENAVGAMDDLVRRYLARDYRSPLVEYQAVDFSLLKCLDMYHSKELEDQVWRFVAEPKRTFRQDNPPKR